MKEQHYKNENVGRSAMGLTGPNSDGEYLLVLFPDFGGCIEASIPLIEIRDAIETIGGTLPQGQAE